MPIPVNLCGSYQVVCLGWSFSQSKHETSALQRVANGQNIAQDVVNWHWVGPIIDLKIRVTAANKTDRPRRANLDWDFVCVRSSWFSGLVYVFNYREIKSKQSVVLNLFTRAGSISYFVETLWRLHFTVFTSSSSLPLTLVEVIGSAWPLVLPMFVQIGL